MKQHLSVSQLWFFPSAFDKVLMTCLGCIYQYYNISTMDSGWQISWISACDVYRYRVTPVPSVSVGAMLPKLSPDDLKGRKLGPHREMYDRSKQSLVRVYFAYFAVALEPCRGFATAALSDFLFCLRMERITHILFTQEYVMPSESSFWVQNDLSFALCTVRGSQKLLRPFPDQRICCPWHH